MGSETYGDIAQLVSEFLQTAADHKVKSALDEALLHLSRASSAECLPEEKTKRLYKAGAILAETVTANPSTCQEAGIACLLEALSFWPRDSFPDHWASAVFALGNACSDRIRGSPSENQERAIDCYQQALGVWTLETSPNDWALAMHALGDAYLARARGDRSENCEKAIECFKQALKKSSQAFGVARCGNKSLLAFILERCTRLADQGPRSPSRKPNSTDGFRKRGHRPCGSSHPLPSLLSSFFSC